MTQTLRKRHSFPGRQAGALTLFSAALILLLMTLMLFYAARVGIFEQRVSANDMNQKLAFHAAEAGIAHAIEYFFANNMLVVSPKEDIFSDGTDGWLAAGNEHWRKCSDYTGDFDDESDPVEIAHPCRGESSDARRANSYFYYYDDPDLTGEDPYAINIDTDSFLQDTQAVSVRAVLCVLVVDFNPATNGGVPVTGCTTDTSVEGEHFMVTFLAQGQSDCNNGTCLGEALVSEPVSNFTALNGPPPSVPLTARSTMPDSGSSTIVTNPNAGGVGVPISVWAANTNACGVTEDLTTGNFETCQPHEFWDSDVEPDNPVAAASNMTCVEAPLSYTVGGESKIGYDVFYDSFFPCDLFEYYFGVPRSAYMIIRNSATIIDAAGCSDLDENTSGLYWVRGGTGTCTLRGGDDNTIGSSEHPIALVTAADSTNINANTKIHGVIYVTDAEDATPGDDTQPNLTINGGAIVSGAMVVDLPKVNGNPNNFNFNGNFKLLYGGSEIVRAHGSGNLGALMGGWTDFPKCWHAAGAGCP